MREELAAIVFPVLRHGLDLYDRLQNSPGEPTFELERAQLIALLQTERDARRFSDYGGDQRLTTMYGGSTEPPRESRFLGIRYGLVCWLDEIFILNSRWEQRWNERKLEVELYGSNERAWQFWNQVQLSTGRPSTDALEGFFLCAMFGFRGERRERADQLSAWVSQARNAVIAAQAQKWTAPAELDPPVQVPPRHGLARLGRAIGILGLSLLVLLPVAAYTVVRWLTH